MSDLKEFLICDERRPGIELVEFQGVPGNHNEHLILSNSLGNGLRFEISDDGDDDNEGSYGWWTFHIQSPETARLIAKRLLEFADRIADPPAAGGQHGQ